MTDLTIKLPDKQTPGYLRRQMTADSFRQKMRAETGQEFWDALIDFILVYVVEPQDRDEAREILLDANEEQYKEILDSINGKTGNPTQAQASETN